MPAKRLVAYASRLSAGAGETVDIMVSSEAPRYRASLVRIISGDSRPRGTGYAEAAATADFDGDYPGQVQPIIPGSYARLGALPALESAAFSCWLMPTIDSGEQTLLTTPDWRIVQRDTNLALQLDGSWFEVPVQLELWRWYRLLVGTHAGASFVQLVSERVVSSPGIEGRIEVPGRFTARAGDWLLCSSGDGGTWNGRIESPCIGSGEVDPADTTGSPVLAPIARWDFAAALTRDTVPNALGDAHPAMLHQQPTRAVTGVRWDGSVHRYTDDPAHYGAAHFHDDDLTDCNWDVSFRWTIPDSLHSAVYGVKLVALDASGQPSPAAEDEFILPICVTAARAKRERLALLVSTATYLSYANQQMSLRPSAILKNPRARNTSDAWLLEHPEIGLSQYDYHRDGSGVHFSSHLRPVLNLAPKVLTWGFCADTNIVAWLEAIDQPYDVVADEDLHRDGAAALEGYRTILTCSHPEYHSTEMLDGIAAWLDAGGRLMYLGGNGFYWRVAFHPDKPGLMEVRRAEDGTRAWISRPGEYYHQFTGEYGGLWRRIGRPPNQLVGIGFAAQGFDGGTYYELQDGARDARAAFILEGLEEGPHIGTYGTQAGGAAGEEIDRWDPELGSPAHALVIASSREHRPGMLRTIEEVHMTGSNGSDDDVRADITFFETPSGGAVFSTGSISYAGSLSPNDYQNDIARLTGNVLKRFLDSEPFTFPDS